MAIKKVWAPPAYEVNIGQGTYIIEPQPIERIIQFDQVVKDMSTSFESLADRYYVTNGDGKDVAGPFDSEPLARAHIESDAHLSKLDEGLVNVRVETLSMREMLEGLVGAPYPALKILIPDLKEEDVRGASLPNLKFAFDLIMEVNGLAWFENFVKNSLAPLVPTITGIILDSIRGALASSTAKAGTNGETASTS